MKLKLMEEINMMLDPKSYTSSKQIEWVTGSLTLIWKEQEALIQKILNASNTLSSSFVGALLTVPCVYIGDALKVKNGLYYLLLIPIYVALWIASERCIIPLVKKALKGNKEVNFNHLLAENVIREFDSVIINRLLLILGTKTRIERECRMDDSVKKIHITNKILK